MPLIVNIFMSKHLLRPPSLSFFLFAPFNHTKLIGHDGEWWWVGEGPSLSSNHSFICALFRISRIQYPLTGESVFKFVIMAGSFNLAHHMQGSINFFSHPSQPLSFISWIFENLILHVVFFFSFYREWEPPIIHWGRYLLTDQLNWRILIL